MSGWLGFGKQKNALPPTTNLQMQKSKQVESLHRLHAVVVEVIRDIEYRVTFPVGPVNFTLIINLPPQFPSLRPTVSVEPLLRHPWVDNQMVISLCPALLAFTMHSSLGSAIQTIMDEFRINPPQLITPNSGALYKPPMHTQSQPFLRPPHSYASSSSSYSGITPTISAHSVPSVHQPPELYFYQMPPIPTSFHQLANKTTTELNTLLNDGDKLQELLETLPEIKKITEDKDTVSKKCAELAKGNLSMKPQIETLKDGLHTNITHLGGLQSTIDAERIKYSELSQQYTLSNILSNLKVAILESEEEAEKVADTFLDKKIVIDQFCKDFLPKRALCHSRRAKEEKLQQIMSSQGHRF